MRWCIYKRQKEEYIREYELFIFPKVLSIHYPIDTTEHIGTYASKKQALFAERFLKNTVSKVYIFSSLHKVDRADKQRVDGLVFKIFRPGVENA
jgi:hypothetical protein